jgi:predicted CoA-binding protein
MGQSLYLRGGAPQRPREAAPNLKGQSLYLSRLLAPPSIAVVGASERPGSYGGEALLNLARLGYAGRVYAVNPGRSSVHGVRAYPSLEDLPEAPDPVVVARPAAAAPAVVATASALGCGGAVVFAAGFAEAREIDLQTELASAATRLPVCGPNGNGIVSLPDRVALWGDAIEPREPGPVALISQSGNVAVNALASRRGLRPHTVISCGNQAVLDATDFLEALCARDGVRSVASTSRPTATACAGVRRWRRPRLPTSASLCSRRAVRGPAPPPRRRTPARWPATSASSARSSRSSAPPGRRTHTTCSNWRRPWQRDDAARGAARPLRAAAARWRPAWR